MKETTVKLIFIVTRQNRPVVLPELVFGGPIYGFLPARGRD